MRLRGAQEIFYGVQKKNLKLANRGLSKIGMLGCFSIKEDKIKE